MICNMPIEDLAALAKAAWNPSLDGWAIVDTNNVFLHVNPQFCEICGVTPAQLIGQNFQDVTAAHIRKLDVDNAQLVRKGIISHYLIDKEYRFSETHHVNVTLLVVGVYNQKNEFLFFLSRIVAAPAKLVISENSSSFPRGESVTSDKASWWERNANRFTIIATAIAAAILWAIEWLRK